MAITPVNNTPGIYPDRPTLKTDTTSSHGSSDGFSLEQALQGQPEQDGVIYEPSSKAGGSESTGPSFSLPGAEEKLKREDSFRESDEFPIFGGFSFTRLLDSLRGILKYLGNNLSRIFSNIWEEKPLTEGTEGFGKEGRDKASSPSADLPPIYLDASSPGDDFDQAIAKLEESGQWNEEEAIKKALDQGDDETFRTLISQGGRKTPARNTSVLTFYNANGKLVQIDPSDENRILRGDRGSRKS